MQDDLINLDAQVLPRAFQRLTLHESETDPALSSQILALPLLVPGIFAEDPDNASSTHHFALRTNRLDRRFHLHGRSLSYLNRYVMRPLVRS
jgi:hypothetical protein